MGFLTNKNVLITGGSRGIGRAIALRAAEEGANVAFTYLSSAAKAAELEAELSQKGVRAKGYCSDAAQGAAAKALIADFVQDFGTLDALINNAGITRDNLLMRMSEAQWDEVINVNLKSVFNLTQAATRTLLKQKFGAIINITSVVGLTGNAGQANYASAKAGIIGFTKSIAQELGSRNIRCNAVAPGFIATEMTDALSPELVQKWQENIPLRRPGKAEEVADLVVFLASDRAQYITGQTLSIDGGMRM
ncbi:MAG: 3-oxoacyl-[acyl-carrier-protein] reductase [Bernardetiaceae bacterium]